MRRPTLSALRRQLPSLRDRASSLTQSAPGRPACRRLERLLQADVVALDEDAAGDEGDRGNQAQEHGQEDGDEQTSSCGQT